MTRNEFGEWLARLKAAFPAVDRFFTREDQDDAANVATLWLDVLYTTPLESANDAIKALASGDLEPPTYLDDWAKLPAIVRRWCREHQAMPELHAKYTPDRTYRCLHCFDKGYGVEIFNPEWIRSFATEIELRELATGWQREARRWCRDHGCGPLTFSCDCSCEEGRELHDLRKHKRMQFEPGHHCEVPPGGENGWADALAEWIAGRDLMEEANRWEYAP